MRGGEVTWDTTSLQLLTRVLDAKTMSSAETSTAYMLWEGREGMTGHLRDVLIMFDVHAHDIL